jgi:hypothetical protein
MSRHSSRLARVDHRASLVVIALIVAWALAVPPVSAQTAATATLRGTVLDTTGAVVPGATVTLINQGTREVRTAVTDSRGGYVFSSIIAGTYTVRVEIEGFKTFEQRNIPISPGDTRGLDVTLEVGQRAETITVTAVREITQTETGAREGVITASQIDNLSIIGRSSLELLRIMPGVTPPEPGVLESVGFLTGGNAVNAGSGASYTVNGVRASNNVVLLDGANLIDIGSNNGVILSPNNDMVQEVKVQSSNYAAEHGSAGMQVSAITKSGTSEFHGSLYDYVRHWRFAANDRSNSIVGKPKPRSKFQFPGGNIGGPVLLPGTEFNRNRDRMFFFFGVEVQRQQVDSGSFLSVVPTLKQRQGDFSEALACVGQNLNQPCGAVQIPGGFPGAGNPAPNNNLAPYAHPLGRVLINLFPAPNYSDPTNRYNYAYQALEPNNRVEFTLRTDYNISESTRAYVRLAYQIEKRDEPRGIWWAASQVALPSPNLADSSGRGASFNLVSVLGETMTNEVLVSYARLKLDNDYKDPSKVMRATYGVPDIGFFPDQSPYLPLELISSGWGSGAGHFGELWSPLGNFLFAYNDTTLVSNKLTKIWNSHALKFGASVEQVNKEQNFQNAEHVRMAYASAWIPGSTGNELGDLLVGRPAQVEQGTRIPIGRFRLYNIDAFAQDSWKVRPNLTLEFGLRFSYMPNNVERGGLGAYFDPAFYDRTQGVFLGGDVTRLNGVRYVRYGQAEKRLTDERDPFWMPRVNFAWDVTGDGDNVIRGGYGLFVNRPMGNTVYDVLRFAPNAYFTAIDAWSGADLGGGRGLTYDTIRLVDPYARIRAGAYDLDSVNPASVDWPKTHSMSISYARRIFWDQVVEAAYVGTQGRSLVSRSSANYIPAGTLLSGRAGNADLSNPVHRLALDSSVLNQFRPFPAYRSIEWWEYKGVSHYHSLQITASRQTGRNFQYFANYTLSKSTGTLGSEYDLINPIFPGRSFGVLDSDRRHIFNISYNWFLPDLSPSPNPVLRGLLNGWQVSGISTFASGYPIRLRFTGDIATGGMATAWFGTPDAAGGTGVGGITPLYLGDPRIKGARKRNDKLFDITKIGIPAFGETGPDQPPYDLRAPWRWNHDITIFKNFRISDTQKVQFRVGVFNLFNQAFASQRFANDIDLTLETRCLRRVSGVPTGIGFVDGTVCDPTGGFEFTENTIRNFGKINILRGRRVVEFALKYYF